MKLHILLSIILLASLSLLGNEPTYIQTSAETIEFTKEGKLITVDSPHNSLFSQNNHLKAKIWDLTTKNPIVTYDTKEPLGKVYLSEDGLIANLDTREKQPILTIYDINQKKLIRTCSPNVHINTIFDTIELIGFSGDNIYLNTNIWNKKENRNEFCTCKINIHTNKQEKYDLYLNSINTSGTYGLVEPSFDLLTTYNLTSKKIIFQKKMLPSETCCWLNDDTFILTPFDLQVEGRKLKYTDLKIMAQKIKGEITCEHEIDPVKNNLIKILSSMNNGTHVLSSNQTGVVQSWNMTLQEQPQTIVNLKERAWELKTMTNSELTAALLAERIVLFDPHQTNQTYRPSQESSCIIN